jgi:hypothetical protein
VLQHLRGDDLVERRVREGQLVGAAVDGLRGRALGHLGCQRVEHPGDVLELGPVEVEGHDLRTAAVEREGVPAAAAAHVEDPLPGLDRELREVDGQHGRAPCR